MLHTDVIVKAVQVELDHTGLAPRCRHKLLLECTRQLTCHCLHSIVENKPRRLHAELDETNTKLARPQGHSCKHQLQASI